MPETRQTVDSLPRVDEDFVRPTPSDALAEMNEIRREGKDLAAQLDPDLQHAVGFTHFDTASSEDNRLVMLMSRTDIHRLASQTLVRIKSNDDSTVRTYLGVVVRGPFAEPDAVPPNSTMAVSVVVQGKRVAYTFDYHGRAEVEILCEESGGKRVPPRYRPRPKSPVFVVPEEQCKTILGVDGDLCLGTVVGYDDMEARIPSADKSVLPRHTGIIGTTGGGKSTTVATLIHKAQAAGISTIILDVEGEYTELDQPTDHDAMLEALKRRGKKPEGVKDLHIHTLVNRAS
jgi:hypothetical protein